MILCKSGRMISSQRGFTLIEVLVALAIISLIGGGVSTATIQILKQGVRNGDYTTASQYTMNAIHWISRDAEMSQTVATDGVSGFPLTLNWIDWGGAKYQVIYTIEDNKLKRSYSVNGGAPSQTVVAEYVNTISENTTCEFGSRVLTTQVTTTVGKGAHAVSVTNVRKIFIRSSP
jgi:prepilin-type N-terminal cleavage/methylation domain-containing protein